jgi:hypothetical protein
MKKGHRLKVMTVRELFIYCCLLICVFGAISSDAKAADPPEIPLDTNAGNIMKPIEKNEAAFLSNGVTLINASVIVKQGGTLFTWNNGNQRIKSIQGNNIIFSGGRSKGRL